MKKQYHTKVILCSRCNGDQYITDKDVPNDAELYDKNHRDDCPFCNAKGFISRNEWFDYWKKNRKYLSDESEEHSVYARLCLVCPVCEGSSFIVVPDDMNYPYGKKEVCSFCNGECVLNRKEWEKCWKENCEGWKSFMSRYIWLDPNW